MDDKTITIHVQAPSGYREDSRSERLAQSVENAMEGAACMAEAAARSFPEHFAGGFATWLASICSHGFGMTTSKLHGTIEQVRPGAAKTLSWFVVPCRPEWV